MYRIALMILTLAIAACAVAPMTSSEARQRGRATFEGKPFEFFWMGRKNGAGWNEFQNIFLSGLCIFSFLKKTGDNPSWQMDAATFDICFMKATLHKGELYFQLYRCVHNAIIHPSTIFFHAKPPAKLQLRHLNQFYYEI